jgi:hypothetical protein
VSAQDYPTFYNTENPAYGNVEVPEPTFPQEPAPCAPDDQDCINFYLNQLGEHIHGSVGAQLPPSPVYNWNAGNCALNNAECGTMESDWRKWTEKAQNASLDFYQSGAQSGEVCQEVYDWWGMRYTYNCQSGH